MHTESQFLGDELKSILPKIIPWLDQPQLWSSLLIDQYPPIIHRLSLKLSSNRTLMLHKLFIPETQSTPAYYHSHSWPLAVKVLQGGYEMGMGFSCPSDRDPPVVTYKSMIQSGDVYEISSSDVWHYTQPLDHEPSYSIMLIGSRRRPRQAQNNEPLSSFQIQTLLEEFKALMKSLDKSACP